MKTVIFQSDDEHKLNLLIQLAKEIGVEVIQHYRDSGDESSDAVREPDEKYTGKLLVKVADKQHEIADDYCLPGPPPRQEALDAWLDDSNDEEGEYTIEEVLDYVRKELEKDKRK